MKSICKHDLSLETGAHQWSTSHPSHTAASPSCQNLFSWFLHLLPSFFFISGNPPHTQKKKPPAGCSCFVGPGAMLQTHTTVKLSSLPAAGMSSPHHHFLGSKFTHKRWGYHRLTIYITGHVWLSEERGGEQKWLVFAKVQQNRKNKAELMPHKEVLICAAHMNTAGSTKLSQ